jgi:hypothetical protein
MHCRPVSDAKRRESVSSLHFLNSFQIDPDHLIAKTVLDLKSSLVIGKAECILNVRIDGQGQK